MLECFHGPRTILTDQNTWNKLSDFTDTDLQVKKKTPKSNFPSSQELSKYFRITYNILLNVNEAISKTK